MNSDHQLRVFTPSECADAVSLMRTLQSEIAQTENGVSVFRQGSVAWLVRSDAYEWIFGRIERLGFEYARQYGIDVDGLDDALQFADYGPGAQFDWHIDTGRAETRRRKVTVSVQLSGGNAYEGGDLEIIGEWPSVWHRSLGSAVAFASVLGHRVTRITRGSRLALVGWMVGVPYR